MPSRTQNPPAASYHGLPLPRTARNLLAHPAASLTAVFGLLFLLVVKVLLVRGRGLGLEREGAVGR